MKGSKTILVICGIIIAAALSISYSMPDIDTQQFLLSKTIQKDTDDKVSHLTITSYSLEVLTKNLPYLNSK